MAIFGSSNLSDSGDLLIFNKVSYKTLLMFEKELGRDRMTYLVEEGLPPDTATASHLESTKVRQSGRHPVPGRRQRPCRAAFRHHGTH